MGKIFIHLARNSDPDDFRIYGSDLVPVRDPLQEAILLEGEGKIAGPAVQRVAGAMREDGVSDVGLLSSVLDLRRRRLRGGPGLDELVAALGRKRHLPSEVQFRASPPSRRKKRLAGGFRVPESLRE